MGKWCAFRRLAAAAGLGLSFALVVALSGVLVPASQRAALGASITASVISGEALASRQGTDFAPLADGTVLRAGDVVRTGPGSRVVLTYFEGSTVEIEPASELRIDEAAFGDEGATVIRMTQAVGRTWHVVAKLVRSGSRYEVRTPVSTAAVRGTAFEVAVAEVSGETKVVTTEGAVATSDASGAHEVVVTPGLETTVTADRPPSAPVPAPAPVRTVSVQLGSQSATVVDPLGRANGIRDGKIVLQTPGARIVRGADGILLILPDVPEGRLAVIERDQPEVRVVTTTEVRGGPSVRVEDTVVRGATSAARGATVGTAPAAGQPAARQVAAGRSAPSASTRVQSEKAAVPVPSGNDAAPKRSSTESAARAASIDEAVQVAARGRSSTSSDDGQAGASAKRASDPSDALAQQSDRGAKADVPGGGPARSDPGAGVSGRTAEALPRPVDSFGAGREAAGSKAAAEAPQRSAEAPQRAAESASGARESAGSRQAAEAPQRAAESASGARESAGSRQAAEAPQRAAESASGARESAASQQAAEAPRAERAERAERPERAERAERAERPERAERAERADRPEREGRGESRSH